MYNFSNEKELRKRIKELTEDLLVATKERDWALCDRLDLDIDDLTVELQLMARPNYYSVEKL